VPDTPAVFSTPAHKLGASREITRNHSMGCCTDEESERLKHLRGLDRAPTADEAADPPDKRPWTEVRS
jgi:hypothetical protein